MAEGSRLVRNIFPRTALLNVTTHPCVLSTVLGSRSVSDLILCGDRSEQALERTFRNGSPQSSITETKFLGHPPSFTFQVPEISKLSWKLPVASETLYGTGFYL